MTRIEFVRTLNTAIHHSTEKDFDQFCKGRDAYRKLLDFYDSTLAQYEHETQREEWDKDDGKGPIRYSTFNEIVKGEDNGKRQT